MIEDYDRAWKLLEDPKRWTRGVFARDEAGKKVQSTDESAVCFCVMGAISRVYGTDRSRLWEKVVLSRPYTLSIPEWNDDPGTTHAEVVGLLKELDV